jgi:hypothetical protein
MQINLTMRCPSSPSLSEFCWERQKQDVFDEDSIAYFTPRRPPVSRHDGQTFHGKAATDFTHDGHPCFFFGVAVQA